MKKILLIPILLLLPLIVLAEASVVFTHNATNINFNSVVLNGEITDHGRGTYEIYDESDVWFEYGQTISYTSKTNKQRVKGENSFSGKISGLTPCTTYHYRTAAENESETSYGGDKVFTTHCKILTSVNVEVKNITKNGGYEKTISADPYDKLLFKIAVESAGTQKAKDVMLKSTLPNAFTYLGNLKIGNVLDTRDLTKEAIELEDLEPGESITITFEAQIGDSNDYPTGLNSLINTVMAYTSDSASTNSVNIQVTGTGVGTPTNVNTGIGTDILYSVVLPFFIAFLIIWIFRSQILGIDKELSKRKVKVEDYRSGKKLKRIIKRRK